MSPQIIHVVGSLQPWGTQRALFGVATATLRQGFVSKVFAATGGALDGTLAAAGIETRQFGNQERPSIAAAMRVAKALRVERPSIVHLWDDWAVNNVGPILACGGGIPYVCSIRNSLPTLTWARRQTGRFVLRRAAMNVSNSAAVWAQAIAALGERRLAHNWRVIQDAPVAEPSLRGRSEVLRELGLPDQVRLIGSASRFTTSKSLRDALFAAALLRMAHDDVRFVFIGDGPAAADVRTFCEQMRMPDLTVFPGTRLDAMDLIRHFNVYVDAAVTDGPSRGIAEAQRCGVPVVCVDTPIRREQVREEIDGMFAPPHDPGALTRQIHELLLDEPLRLRLGAAGREQALVDAERNAGPDDMLQLYRGIADRHAAPSPKPTVAL